MQSPGTIGGIAVVPGDALVAVIGIFRLDARGDGFSGPVVGELAGESAGGEPWGESAGGAIEEDAVAVPWAFAAGTGRCAPPVVAGVDGAGELPGIDQQRATTGGAQGPVPAAKAQGT